MEPKWMYRIQTSNSTIFSPVYIDDDHCKARSLNGLGDFRGFFQASVVAGLMVPLNEDGHTILDLIAHLEAEVVVVPRGPIVLFSPLCVVHARERNSVSVAVSVTY